MKWIVTAALVLLYCVPALAQSMAYDDYRQGQKLQQAINNEVNRARIDAERAQAAAYMAQQRDRLNQIANQLNTQARLGQLQQQIKILQKKVP